MISSSSLPQLVAPRKIYPNRSQIQIPSGAVLVYSEFEERSIVDGTWRTSFGNQNVYKVVVPGNDLHTAKIPKYGPDSISLRDTQQLGRLVDSFHAKVVLLDITGLPHHIWMPLLRACIDAPVKTSCIYVEPESYTYSPSPKPDEFFDLSERIRGFSPIPTFARLAAARPEEAILIPLLGFEGVRFRHLIETLEPSERDVEPVVGVPGFELEYPFHTYEGNASVLSSTRSWQRLSFIDASCPFALFCHLHRLRKAKARKQFQIATVGTKPHALGATLYAMTDPKVELLYDHPVKSKKRTRGASKCHLYMVSDFMNARNVTEPV